jgi:hypothetical protein
MTSLVREQGAALEQAKSRAMHFLSSSEHLIELSTECGAETPDSPDIRKVFEVAALIAQCFEQAVASEEIAMAELFDENYVKIPNTTVRQLRTRFVDFTDCVLPALQEAVLEFSGKVMFCAAVDRNGYFSHPPPQVLQATRRRPRMERRPTAAAGAGSMSARARPAAATPASYCCRPVAATVAAATSF